MAHEWKIYVRDKNLRRIGEVDNYRQFEAVLKFNDVGTFELILDRRQPIVADLITPGYGIFVIHEVTGQILVSGSILGHKHERDGTSDFITLTGKDDNWFLTHRVSHPEPNDTTPPYDVSEHFTASGPASTVLRAIVNAQLGPGAIAPRRLPHLVMGADPGVGKDVEAKLRWTPMLEDMQELALAGGDIGFRIVQVPETETLEFQVYQPEDKTAIAKFSEEWGNLEGYDFEASAPETTYVYVGGQGEGLERKIKEGQKAEDVATWWRIEEFNDRRDVSNEDENSEEVLQQRIDETLAEKGAKATLKVVPIDTDGLTFGVDYGLGDKVTIILSDPEEFGGTPLDGITIQNVMREVKLHLSQDQSYIEPTIGDPTPAELLKIFTDFKRLAQRVNNLESI